MKRFDPNHLIAETRHSPAFAPQLIDPNIDLLTRHYYPDYKGSGADWAAAVRREVGQIKGQRPFFAGEFGPYIDGRVLTRENVEGALKAFLDTCVDTPGVSARSCGACTFTTATAGSTGTRSSPIRASGRIISPVFRVRTPRTRSA
jgi:hypothetical protein